MEVPEAVLVQTLSLVDEGLALLVQEQVESQRQLLETNVLVVLPLLTHHHDVLLHGKLSLGLLVIGYCKLKLEFVL